jgi:monoterpene epsilon-lactone hydrolase
VPADVTTSSGSLGGIAVVNVSGKAAVDPALTPEGLRRRAIDYLPAGDRMAELVSPIFADLTELPLLLAQAGSLTY